MTNRSLSATGSGSFSSLSFSAPLVRSLVCGVLLAAATLGLTACGPYYYKFPVYTFANRPVPPSKLAERVLIAVGNSGLAGTGGSLVIVDALRDIRNNVQNTIPSFSVSGFSSALPTMIYSFPEQTTGYIYSNTSPAGSLTAVNYGTESGSGSAAGLTAQANSIAIPTDFSRYFAAEEAAAQLLVFDNGSSKAYALNLPNVYRVAANVGGTVAIAMVRNSNTLYQVVKLNSDQYQTEQMAAAAPIVGQNAAGQPINTGGINAVDCQPYNLPVYCVVPVPGAYDRPVGAYFSVDGTTVYVLNCGVECGGATSSITAMQQGVLNINNVSQTGFSNGNPASYTATNHFPVLGLIANTLVPGGATVAVSDGTTLYVAGQRQMTDGLFTGSLSTVSLATNTVTGQYPISDGSHSKILFADDNTLWIGSQFCATGERAKLGQNYNCLTRFDLGAKTAAIVPNVTPGGATTVPYPNTNLNLYYYGDLTGLCWVQNLHKVYTAYGGQVHVFNTADGSEINNSQVTVQGTALDVAYMDAITNQAN